MPANLSATDTDAPGLPLLSRSHARRLREVYRSAGWPCLDNIEIDLLNAGLLERMATIGTQPQCLRVTDAGLRAIGTSLNRNRAAFDAHETLVQQVARDLAATGRLVYRSLKLRARVEERWKLCKPDVYSIRHTSVAAYAEPTIHEIKVRRGDLLGDLTRPDKRASYQALSSAFYYVMPEALATVDEIPPECGVLFMGPSGLRLGRRSPHRNVELTVAEWMALARRGAEFIEQSEDQALLRAAQEAPARD